jgi:hypothetical protein
MVWGLVVVVSSTLGTPPALISFSGFIVDTLCYNMCAASGAADCAIDGTNVITRPHDHMLACLREPACSDSGYFLAFNIGTAAAPSYRARFVLDSALNGQALALLGSSAISVQAGLAVTVIAYDDGSGTLRNGSLVECVASQSPAGHCDGRLALLSNTTPYDRSANGFAAAVAAAPPSTSQCRVFCATAVTTCAPWYPSLGACLLDCAFLAAGAPGDSEGNSLSCREAHLRKATDSAASAAVHCPHAALASTLHCNGDRPGASAESAATRVTVANGNRGGEQRLQLLAEPAFTLWWNLSLADDRISLRLQAVGDVWLAIGVNADGAQMVGTHALISTPPITGRGSPSSSSSPVQRYRLSAKAVSGVVLDNATGVGGTNSFGSAVLASSREYSAATRMTTVTITDRFSLFCPFCRKTGDSAAASTAAAAAAAAATCLPSASTSAAAAAAAATGTITTVVPVNFALGVGATLSHHGAAQRGSFAINFLDGTQTTALASTADADAARRVRAMHGIVLGLGWSMPITAGIFVARYRRVLYGQYNPALNKVGPRTALWATTVAIDTKHPPRPPGPRTLSCLTTELQQAANRLHTGARLLR